MKIPLTKDIFWIGVNDLETELFEALWPLPKGISYNSYLICDEKTALIDAVKENFSDDLIARLKPALAQGKTIDYLVINHIEPDHSGAIGPLSALYPNMCIVGNEKPSACSKAFIMSPTQSRSLKRTKQFRSAVTRLNSS